MNATGSNEYLRTKILTASPEQLQLMLYDGAIRFARQAREAMDQQRLEDSCERILRAQKIVLEMSASLRHDVDAELCSRIAGLYTYIYRRMVDANMHRDIAALDEALELLEYQRETWVLLLDKLAERRKGSGPHASAASSRSNLAGQVVSQYVSQPIAVDVAG